MFARAPGPRQKHRAAGLSGAPVDRGRLLESCCSICTRLCHGRSIARAGGDFERLAGRSPAVIPFRTGVFRALLRTGTRVRAPIVARAASLLGTRKVMTSAKSQTKARSNSAGKPAPPAVGDYCLISPARNEAEYIRETLDSVLAQTVPPKRWIIVDDGSTDDTPKILSEYAEHHSVIEVHTRADRGRRALGGGVVETFNFGLD